jgi:ATP-dependent Clp protease adaptor protein ClpS
MSQGSGESPDKSGGNSTAVQEKISEKTSEKIKHPSMYRVLLLNDDFTPMDFVVHVLKKFFKKTDPEANEIMLKVHTAGKGVAGVYTFEIAEMKVEQVNIYSKRHRHPLKTVSEED